MLLSRHTPSFFLLEREGFQFQNYLNVGKVRRKAEVRSQNAEVKKEILLTLTLFELVTLRHVLVLFLSYTSAFCVLTSAFLWGSLSLLYFCLPTSDFFLRLVFFRELS